MVDRMPLWAFMTMGAYSDWLYDDMTVDDDDDDLLDSFYFDDDDEGDDDLDVEEVYEDDPTWYSNMIY